MERNIVAVVDHSQGSNAAFSKSVASSFKNNSLFIDLGIPKARNMAGKCPHFSLRGYVADMRKRDRDICLPFASDGNIGNSVDQLPELDVPKFRWWCCQNCLLEVGLTSALEEPGEVPKCRNTGLPSGITCHPSPSNYNSEIRMSDIQEASKLEKSERRKVDENAPANLSMNGHETADKIEADKFTSGNLCGNENHSSPYTNKIGKKTKARITAVYGHAISLDNDDVHESAKTDFHRCKDDPCSTEERCPDHQVAVESKSMMLADTFLLMPGSNNAAGNFSGTENTKCRANSSTEDYPEKEFAFVEAKVGNVAAGCKANPEECSKMSKVITTCQLVRHPSLQLEDSADRLSENDGILTGDNEQSQQDYSSGGFPRRKSRKVRLLTELLGGKKNSKNNQTEGSSNLVSEVTSMSVSLSVPQGKFSPYDKVRSVVSAPQRKRKIPSDQERKHVNGHPSYMGEKARALKGDVHASTGAIDIYGSESEKNVDGVAVSNSYKSHWSRRERSALGGNKRKRTQVGGEQLSSVPWQQAINKLNHAKVRDASEHSAAADTSYLKPVHDSFTDRGMELSFRDVMPQRIERKSISSKKKNRMLQVEGAQSFARRQINHTFGEDPLKRKDIEITGTEYDAANLHSEPKLCADVLDLSLNSRISLHRDERDYAEGAALSFTPTRKGILHGNHARKDGLYGELRGLHNSTPEQCSKEEILLNLNNKIARGTAILREQQNYSPHPSNGSFSLHQNLDFSDPHNNEKNSRIREHPEAISLNTDLGAEVSAKGNSDDIPMEIIELLSKGKYEKEWGLSQDESSYYRPARDNTRNENVITSPKANGNGVVPVLHINYPSTAMRKPTSNVTIDMIRAASVPPTNNDPLKFSDKQRSLFNMGQMGNPPFSGFEAFSPSQPKVLTDAQFSHSGFLSIRNLQNSEQRHKLIAQLPSPTNMKIFEPINRTHNSLQQSKAGSIWSSLAPNHMPFGHNIPQKFPNQLSNMGTDSQLREPGKGKRILNFDLNAVDLNGASIEEQNKRASAEYPFLTKNTGMELNPKGRGLSDALHREETIPAMQLLSLMDAGTQSSKPLGLDGKEFLSKPFSPCSNHSSFSGNEKPSFLEKPLFPESGFMPRSGESSRQYRSALIRENLPGQFYEYPSAVPSIDSLFRNVEKSPGLFTHQVLRAQELEEGEGSYSAAHNGACRLDKLGDQHDIGHPNPGKGKETFTAVNSLVYPLKQHQIEDLSNCGNLGPFFMHETVRPMKDWPCTDVCTVNRNPADFSLPEAGNEYMISCEDLKCGKKGFPWGKSVLKDLNGKKKRRKTKDHTSK